MLRILFTYPEEVPYERNLIINLMNEGWDYLHLRKPGHSVDETRNYLELLPVELHQKIVLHDHYELADEFELAGLNWNKRNAEKSRGVNFFSYSAHSFDEIDQLDDQLEYVFLSPVFDSISKSNYTSAFADTEQLKSKLKNSDHKVIALGGVTAEKVNEVKDLGFAGYAMLGHIWKPHLKLAPWDND